MALICPRIIRGAEPGWATGSTTLSRRTRVVFASGSERKNLTASAALSEPSVAMRALPRRRARPLTTRTAQWAWRATVCETLPREGASDAAEATRTHDDEGRLPLLGDADDLFLRAVLDHAGLGA